MLPSTRRVHQLDVFASDPCTRGVGHPKVKHLPKGWEIVKSKRTNHGSTQAEWIILCVKDDDRSADTDYVTWRTEGIGCYLGHYTNSPHGAVVDFADR